jgi:hypothetical protein
MTTTDVHHVSSDAVDRLLQDARADPHGRSITSQYDPIDASNASLVGHFVAFRTNDGRPALHLVG